MGPGSSYYEYRQYGVLISTLHSKLLDIPRILENQNILNLTKIIERIIKIYDTK